ncbi:DUF3040 domain-containing protein [Nucisporomicrobium flavum]|uniref:DUF3040 domain-containing protein n=1 Tax=Nucisporomicrobium flavum TaxID=2785915 RepID=UPI0018F4D918|nr:DUF3040 domain-containing protein [Nucisporomicrobium flavum]
MPDPTFDAIVSQLRAEDPDFIRRVRKLDSPHGTVRLVLAILLWTLAPMCIVLGGWTGAIMAVVGGAYGVHLMRHRHQPHAGAADPARHRRPGASL